MISLRSILKEIVGAESRCTNLTVKSFGICWDKPIMRWKPMLDILKSEYSNSEFNIYRRYPLVNMMYQRSDSSKDEFFERLRNNVMDVDIDELDWEFVDDNSKMIRPKDMDNIHDNLYGIFTKTTTNQVIKTIADQNAHGHYIFDVRAHVLALHYTSRGIWIVDNEEKFQSRRQVIQFVAIDSSKADRAFEDFLETTEKTGKIQKIG